MRVIVTGGLGAVGSWAARAFAERGHDVLLVDNRLPGGGSNDRNVADLIHEVSVVEGDVGDEALLERCLPGAEVVVHAAAHVSHTAGLRDPIPDVTQNVLASARLAKAVLQHCPKARLLYTSTRGVYGRPRSLPVDESHPVDPLGIHEWSKAAAEAFLQTEARVNGLHSTILRITNAYGPGSQIRSPDSAVINWFIGRVLRNEPITLFDEGRMRRDLVYAADVGAALRACAETDLPPGEVYNVGSPEALSLKEIAEAIVRANGGGEIVMKPYTAERRKLEIGDFATSHTKLTAATGWRPSTSLEAGLRTTIEYYRRFKGDYD